MSHRIRRCRVLLGALAVLAFAFASPRALAAPAGSPLARLEVPITVHIPQLAAVHVQKGAALRVSHPERTESVVALPEALVLKVQANTRWELTIATATGFPIEVIPSGGAAGSVTVWPRPDGAVSIVGGAGELPLTWDVAIRLPEGAPQGVYDIPLVMQVTTL